MSPFVMLFAFANAGLLFFAPQLFLVELIFVALFCVVALVLDNIFNRHGWRRKGLGGKPRP